MRILHISSAKTFGGGERHLVDLCRGLTERGHIVFAALRPTNEWQNRLDFLPKENLLQVSIRNSFGVLSGIRIGEFIRDKQINIVHAHLARDYIPASIACLTAKRAKFVFTRHVLFPLKPFNRFALKNLAAAIAVSSAVGEELAGIFPRRKIEVIHNGLDVKSYSVEEAENLRREFREFHNIPLEAPLIGTLGELKELKGQRDFVLAANEIAKRLPETRFVVTGKDNTIKKTFRAELKRLVSVFGLEDSFLWLDWLEDTAPFFTAIDVFVSPSHSESFGLAILEAMAHGKPVVATETEGAKELLGSEGILVPIKDPLQMSEKIVELFENEDRLTEHGNICRNIAAEKFSLDQMVDKTERVYQKLVI